MISKKQKEAVTINLDGKEVEVPAGVNLIEAAALHGKEILIIAIIPSSVLPGIAACAWWKWEPP